MVRLVVVVDRVVRMVAKVLVLRVFTAEVLLAILLVRMVR